MDKTLVMHVDETTSKVMESIQKGLTKPIEDHINNQNYSLKSLGDKMDQMQVSIDGQLDELGDAQKIMQSLKRTLVESDKICNLGFDKVQQQISPIEGILSVIDSSIGQLTDLSSSVKHHLSIEIGKVASALNNNEKVSSKIQNDIISIKGIQLKQVDEGLIKYEGLSGSLSELKGQLIEQKELNHELMEEVREFHQISQASDKSILDEANDRFINLIEWQKNLDTLLKDQSTLVLKSVEFNAERLTGLGDDFKGLKDNQLGFLGRLENISKVQVFLENELKKVKELIVHKDQSLETSHQEVLERVDNLSCKVTNNESHVTEAIQSVSSSILISQKDGFDNLLKEQSSSLKKQMEIFNDYQLNVINNMESLDKRLEEKMSIQEDRQKEMVEVLNEMKVEMDYLKLPFYKRWFTKRG